MEIGTGKPVSRRSALGGMGAAMALPLVGSASPVILGEGGGKGRHSHGARAAILDALGCSSWPAGARTSS